MPGNGDDTGDRDANVVSDAHYAMVSDRLFAGRVIPFLGAGVNLCGRRRADAWEPKRQLPGSGDLAQHLAKRFRYKDPNDPERTLTGSDLVRVSQYGATMVGTQDLYEALHELFIERYVATPVHTFLAGLPHALDERQLPKDLLIITTNYDDTLERAFDAAGAAYDLVSYVSDRADEGRFVHTPPKPDSPIVISKPNEYTGLLNDRPTILKIHGHVDRDSVDGDNYVITEDHYIDFLASADISKTLPVSVAERLYRSHFLFLGYSLNDWNLRVILQRIWKGRRLSLVSWAIKSAPTEFESIYWAEHQVQVRAIPVDAYIKQLAETAGVPSDDAGGEGSGGDSSIGGR